MRLHLHQLERQEEEEDAAAEAGAGRGQRRGSEHSYFHTKLGSANASVAGSHGELLNIETIFGESVTSSRSYSLGLLGDKKSVSKSKKG